MTRSWICLFFCGVCLASTCQAADSLDVILRGVEADSLWRLGEDPWQVAPLTVDRGGAAAGFSLPLSLDGVFSVDIRPNGEPWFSSHLLAPQTDLVKDFNIYVGDRVGDAQQFWYGDTGPLELPVKIVPEPSALMLCVYAGGLIGLVIFFRDMWRAIKDEIANINNAAGPDAANAATATADHGSERERTD